MVRWETRPALRTTEFFLTAAALGDSADIFDQALLAHSFRDVFRLDGPVRMVLLMIAGLARLLGEAAPCSSALQRPHRPASPTIVGADTDRRTGIRQRWLVRWRRLGAGLVNRPQRCWRLG